MSTIVDGQAGITFPDSSNQQTVGYTGGGIYFTASNNISYSISSDARLKTNVTVITNGLDIITRLNPVRFTWVTDGSQGEGFLANELQSIIPIAVNGEPNALDSDGKPLYQVADYSKMIPHLVAAIRELKAEFDAYKESHP